MCWITCNLLSVPAVLNIVLSLCITWNRISGCVFFSSRRRHTRWPRDWSSDVCSSDLAAVAAAVQAAADGLRDGAVLPDRPLLPGRGLPCRPAAGVHPAGRGDELRRAGRCDRPGRAGAGGAVGADRLHHPHPDPADDLRRGDAPVRHRQAGPAVRAGADRPDHLLRRHRLPGVPGPLCRCSGDARWRLPAAPAVRRLAGVGQAARRQGAGVRDGRRGRHSGWAGGEEPHRGRTGRARRGDRRTAGDCIFFAAGAQAASRALLGAARLEIGRRCELIDPSAWAFVWVVDAPLFKPTGEDDDVAVGSGAWTAVHHAFTSPTPEWIDSFESDPGNALAYAYDIVCNGNEIGGGSLRIHRKGVQERVFQVMGLSGEEAQEKLGFLLDAFAYGAPPPGGMALGWDRIEALAAEAHSL